jgi:hypothetical protein
MRINTEAAKRYLDPEYINAYSLLHSQGIYEGQRATTSRKRVVNLPLRIRRSTTLFDDHLVRRSCGELGNLAPANSSGTELLRDWLALLDIGYWSVLRQEKTGVVVLVR